jgi:hypothetical protein
MRNRQTTIWGTYCAWSWPCTIHFEGRTNIYCCISKPGIAKQPISMIPKLQLKECKQFPVQFIACVRIQLHYVPIFGNRDIFQGKKKGKIRNTSKYLISRTLCCMYIIIYINIVLKTLILNLMRIAFYSQVLLNKQFIFKFVKYCIYVNTF